MNPIDIASQLLGAGEVPDRAMIQDYLHNGGVNLDPVETAWCAAFVNATLGQAGMEGTGSNMARSFLDWGQPVDSPQRGDLAIFSRGDPNGPYGHVGFFESVNPDGSFNILGGNQGNSVSLARYAPNALLGFRRAEDEAAPELPRGNALAAYDPVPELATPRLSLNPTLNATRFF